MTDPYDLGARATGRRRDVRHLQIPRPLRTPARQELPEVHAPQQPAHRRTKTDVRAWWPACTRWEALS